MKKYSAFVTKGTKIIAIKNQEYSSKADFIKDLRANGYKVNPQKVKESAVFEYIVNNTNMYPWDWQNIKKVP